MEFRFYKITTNSWIALAAIVILGIIMAVIACKGKKWTPTMLASAAICIALSFVLSYIRLWKMPQGGSVTLASMMPLMAFAYLFGTVPGLVAGLAYGILQFIQSPEYLNFAQFLLEYPIAFGCLGLAGLGGLFFKNAKKNSMKEYPAWVIGFAIAGFARYLCHFVAGFVFWGQYADLEHYSSAITYSAVYNSVVLIDAAICIVIVAIPVVRKALRMMTLPSSKQSAAIEEE